MAITRHFTAATAVKRQRLTISARGLQGRRPHHVKQDADSNPRKTLIFAVVCLQPCKEGVLYTRMKPVTRANGSSTPDIPDWSHFLINSMYR